MKKNGTEYLALLELSNGEIRYEIIKYGTSPAFFDPTLKKGWVTQVGIKPRIKKVISYIELKKAVKLIKTNMPKVNLEINQCLL